MSKETSLEAGPKPRSNQESRRGVKAAEDREKHQDREKQAIIGKNFRHHERSRSIGKCSSQNQEDPQRNRGRNFSNSRYVAGSIHLHCRKCIKAAFVCTTE